MILISSGENPYDLLLVLAPTLVLLNALSGAALAPLLVASLYGTSATAEKAVNKFNVISKYRYVSGLQYQARKSLRFILWKDEAPAISYVFLTSLP